MNNITTEDPRSEQFRELEKLKQDLLQARGWLLPQSIQDRLFEWFVEKETAENSKRSQKIFEEIMELYIQYKKQEPIVQVELSLWKMACLLNPPTSTTTKNNNNTGSNNKASDHNFDAVDYFVRGGWKKYKSAMRHDPMIGIVITNILPFLTNIDYEISSIKADYYNISTVFVSNAGSDEVNGIYTNPHNKMRNDAPIFTKPGTYEGDAVTYSIYKEDDVNLWYISILQTDEDPEELYDTDFYNNDHPDNYKQIPPTDNWVTCFANEENRGGICPPPLIIPLKK